MNDEITVLSLFDGMVVDHINRNKLDNRRNNLRIFTSQQNNRNMPLLSKNKNGVTGVFIDKKTDKWRVQIYHNGKPLYIGSFDIFENAVAARAKAESKYRTEN